MNQAISNIEDVSAFFYSKDGNGKQDQFKDNKDIHNNTDYLY